MRVGLIYPGTEAFDVKHVADGVLLVLNTDIWNKSLLYRMREYYNLNITHAASNLIREV